MSGTAAELVSRLRAGVNPHAASAHLQGLYEHWVAMERWPLEPVGLALLVGVDPTNWAAHVATSEAGASAAALAERLRHDLGIGADGAVDALRLYAWSRQHGVEFPQAGAQLFDFIARTLPGKAAPDVRTAGLPGGVGDAEERAAVLGAALALATRFTEQCLDSERMFDSARMVALLRAQSAVWFGERPPRMDDATMTALIERHVHG